MENGFRPIVAFLQPRHIMEHGVDFGFYAAMIGVDRLTLAYLCILEAVGLLLGGEKLDILPKRALVAAAAKRARGQ